MDSLSDPKHCMPDEARLAVIREQIAEYNRERPAIQRQAYIQVGIFMGAYAVVVMLMFIAMVTAAHAGKIFGFIFALVLIGGYYIWDFVWKPVRDHQMSLRYRLFPVVFGFIDEVRYSNGTRPGFLNDIRHMKLIHFTGSENDDVIGGVHDGLDFDMVESKLIVGSKGSSNGSRNQTVVFRGLIFHFTREAEFPGMLVAARRGNRLQEWLHDMFGSHDDTVATGNTEIDTTHEIHTDNPAAAMPVARGALASALLYLKHEWRGGEARIALRGRECFLLLPADRDYFALPGIGTDIDYATDIAPMIRDMVVLLAVAHLISKVE